MRELWDFLSYFVFIYPLYMSFVWTVGGLLFYARWEHVPPPRIDRYPFFSVLIAAHNEEQHIAEVVRELRRVEYPGGFEIIAVNDGSTDGTGPALDALLDEAPNLRVIHLTPNSGKSRALNTALLVSRGKLILVIDADCYVDKGALTMMAWHFAKYPRVGAVTGNPRIINRTSLLGKIQVGEYSSIIGLIKRSQRLLGKVLTVSGVMAAYRKSAFCDSGVFDADTLTEDIDISWKLQRNQWEIRYEPRALCHILSPETIKGLWKQRVRWAQGGVGVIRKHYDVWFDWKQRRFWPIYLEYVFGILWAFSLAVLTFVYLLTNLVVPGESVMPLILPPWSGSMLALVCVLQFLVSMYIDQRYERKRNLLKYYFSIIWYPLVYWLISALTLYVGVYRVYFTKGAHTATWESPDRGMHTIE